jgi:peptidoglycan/xylan/chitin deacetylase (PgdA/CDA1 family)
MVSRSKLVKVFGPIGLYAFIRWLTRKNPRIVMFHRFSSQPKKNCVSSVELEKQIIYLKKRFNLLPLSQLRQCIEEGRSAPNNSIVLTIDDGYRDFYDVAYPIFKKHGVPATLYVTTGFINQELWLWPDKIAWLLDCASSVNKTIDFGQSEYGNIKIADVDESNRHQIWSQITSYLLAVDDKQKHEWIDYFARELGKSLPEMPPDEYVACSWTELEEMQNNGIEVGGHTHTHPSLGQVSDEQLYCELNTCMNLLDENLGKRQRDFCFPNGQPNDYNQKVKNVTKRVGFKSAVTAFYDALGTNDLFEMRRHSASEKWFQFCKSVNGVETLGSKLLGNFSQRAN